MNALLTRLAHAQRRRPRWILAVTVAVLVLATASAAGAMGRLQLARFEVPGSPSVRAMGELAAAGSGTPSVTILVSAADPSLDADSDLVATRAAAVEGRLRTDASVADVFSYWSTGGWEALRSADGRTGIIQARLVGDVTTARSNLSGLVEAVAGDHGGTTVAVGGRDEVFRQVAAQARSDFGLAEAIILPGVYLLLVIALRRWGAAALVLGLGLAAVALSMGVVGVVAGVMEVSTFAANLVLVMGLALGVDYGLFVLARYAEARREGNPPDVAASDAVRHAGEAVLGSALVVGLALLGLLLLPFPFLRSFTHSGLAVVGAAAGLAVVVVPVLLPPLDRRLDLSGVRLATRGDGRFAEVARTVMRRPVLALVASALVLVTLASPALGLRVGPPDDRILPPTASSRLVQERIRTGFDAQVADALFLTRAVGQDTAGAVSRIDGVAEVHAGGRRLVAGEDRGPAPALLPAGLLVVPATARLEVDPAGLVGDVKAALTGTGTADVGGYPAVLADYRVALLDRLPWVLGWVVAASFVALAVLTRSLVLPLKAVLVNVLGLAVLAGALVWVFQDGHLAGLVRATATGTLDPSIPILLCCVAFGLSMDYEVLLLSRVLEEHRAGARLEDAVAVGLQRSAPLITLAGLILAASFLVYLTSGVAYLQMIGIGMALVVALDATLVRLVLVPAAMALLGEANFWLPGAAQNATRGPDVNRDPSR